jgi:pilus assembly protein FimV
VANRETFLRYGADRPAFLSSTTFKVAQDSQGRPVLAVRSTESFTEPLVNLLVDLHWRNNELVREYTLLLDPAGFASAPPAPAAPNVPAAPPAATPVVETKTQTVARQMDPPTDESDPGAERAVRKTTHIKVGARATLRGIAWRVGERSDSDLQKMMIAIFRANPSAFDGNINRLYRGALLTIPSFAEVAAISPLEAKHEFHAQMAAWRGSARTVAAVSGTTVPPSVAPAASVVPSAGVEPPAATVAPAAPMTAAAEPAAAVEPLDQRVQSLEKELGEMKGLLQTEQVQLKAMQRQAEHGAAAPNSDVSSAADAPQAADPQTAYPQTADPQTVAAPQSIEPPQAQAKQGYTGLIAGLGTLAAALAALYFRFRRRTPAPTHAGSEGKMDAAGAHAAVVAAAAALAAEAPGAAAPHSAGPAEPARSSAPAASDDHPADARPTAKEVAIDATNPMLPILPASAGRSERAGGAQAAPQDTTVSLQVDTLNLRMSSTQLDYNLVDLDLTAQHVQMPSVLNENAVVKERRTNLADVLKLAIEREPDRHDLRMKLLELYYSAAATNRKAFLEVVQKFARDRDYLKTDQWDKIAFMGRQIAADSPLFAEESASDDDLANCA